MSSYMVDATVTSKENSFFALHNDLTGYNWFSEEARSGHMY